MYSKADNMPEKNFLWLEILLDYEQNTEINRQEKKQLLERKIGRKKKQNRLSSTSLCKLQK